MINSIILKPFIYALLIVGFIGCQTNIHTVSDNYDNGQPMYSGKYILCQYNDSRLPEIIVTEERKFGHWKAYYPNGAIKEIRNYTKEVTDCQTKVLKEGIWEYYNPNGELYRTENYRQDTLINSEWDIYHKDQLIGKNFKSDLRPDSIIIFNHQVDTAFLTNPAFKTYYYKPVTLENNGQNPIESSIPFWYSLPDGGTPDYYNPYRTITGIPPHVLSKSKTEEPFGLVGLILYLEKESNFNLPDYTESIQTKLSNPLEKGITYCVKIDIRLSANAGYSVDQLEIVFTRDTLVFSSQKPPESSRITFNQNLNNSKQWETLCADYTANGNEQYLSIGRFAKRSQINVQSHLFRQRSSLDVNESAYYLISQVQLYEKPLNEKCECQVDEIIAKNIIPDRFPVKPKPGDTIQLGNIHFEFNSYNLNKSSLPQLGELRKFLNQHPDLYLTIIGHTDYVGTEKYNLKLSQQRAKEVGNWLISNGIKAQRIKTSGMGDQYPISTTEQELNRRVEIIIE